MSCAKAAASDAYDALNRYAASSEDVAKVYVWFDLLCTNHHSKDDARELPMMWWSHTYRSSVKAVGETCLLLHPWDEPAPLRDSWCHWQLHCTIQAEAKLRERNAEANAFLRFQASSARLKEVQDEEDGLDEDYEEE